MWLIDSSKYIDWMRTGRNPTPLLRPFVLADQLRSCGLIRVEVIRGAIKPAVKAELTTLLEAIPEISLASPLWTRIAALAWQLDRQGTVLPVSDLIIGVCALEADATVITTDTHFQQIPDLRVQANLPVFEHD